MSDELLDDLSKIEGWFSVDIFEDVKLLDTEKFDILQILLHHYAERGLLEAKKIDSEWCFIHPLTLQKLYRNKQIDDLLKSDKNFPLENSKGTLPLPQESVLAMIDARQLNLNQLKQKLGIEKEEGVKNWLRNHGINPKKQGRQKVVYEFIVELALQEDLINELKFKYPEKWHKIYEAKSECDKMTEAIFELHPPKNIKEPNKNIKPYTKRIS